MGSRSRGPLAGVLLALSLFACGGPCPACGEASAPRSAAGEGDDDEGVCLETRGAEAPGAAVSTLPDAERRRSPSDDATLVVLARGQAAFVARLEIDPGAAIPEHRDADEEIVHVLEGTGAVTIDGVRSEVGPGSTILMPASALVSFQNGASPMVVLQVFAGPGSAAKFNRWPQLPTGG